MWIIVAFMFVISYLLVVLVLILPDQRLGYHGMPLCYACLWPYYLITNWTRGG